MFEHNFYQRFHIPTVDEDGRYHEGAATLISRAKSETSVLKRKGSPIIDPVTGKQTYKEVYEEYTDPKTGKVKVRTQASTKMAETDDARTLSSGTPQEEAYADYANKMKSLGNQARKEMLATGKIQYSASAKEAYQAEVDSLSAKLNVSLMNAPRERQAQVIANATVQAKKQDNPDMTKAEIKKEQQRALTQARIQVGANRQPIEITDREWAAIQAGAISENSEENKPKKKMSKKELYSRNAAIEALKNGHSLKYIADHGAAELWGVDISASQIEHTRNFLDEHGIIANLICSPMENDCKLPCDYFDLIYSVYGIGWTTDLDKTFKHIYSYLKYGGEFVFGWSHPIHKCVSIENNELIFSNSYFNEEWYCADMRDKKIMLSNRMLSTYINALADNGFIIEKLVEQTDREKAMNVNNDYGRKALMLPTAFIIKARKL